MGKVHIGVLGIMQPCCVKYGENKRWIDVWIDCEALDEYIPKQLANQTGRGGRINPDLLTYIYSFV